MCAITGMVEVWLQRLVEGMQGTIKAIVKRAARNVAEMGLQDFIFSHPAQVALLGLQFQWTAETQVRACARAVLQFHRAFLALAEMSLVHHGRVKQRAMCAAACMLLISCHGPTMS